MLDTRASANLLDTGFENELKINQIHMGEKGGGAGSLT